MWNAVGFTFLSAGLVGYWVPGLPGTVFMILALGAFMKGANEKQVAWILNHPLFGHILRDWHENKWISARVKVISVSCVVFFSTVSIIALRPVWTRKATLVVIPVSIAVTAVAGVAYILSCRTKPSSATAGPRAQLGVDVTPGEVFSLARGEADPGAGDDASFDARHEAESRATV